MSDQKLRCVFLFVCFVVWIEKNGLTFLERAQHSWLLPSVFISAESILRLHIGSPPHKAVEITSQKFLRMKGEHGGNRWEFTAGRVFS